MLKKIDRICRAITTKTTITQIKSIQVIHTVVCFTMFVWQLDSFV